MELRDGGPFVPVRLQVQDLSGEALLEALQASPWQGGRVLPLTQLVACTLEALGGDRLGLHDHGRPAPVALSRTGKGVRVLGPPGALERPDVHRQHEVTLQTEREAVRQSVEGFDGFPIGHRGVRVALPVDHQEGQLRDSHEHGRAPGAMERLARELPDARPRIRHHRCHPHAPWQSCADSVAGPAGPRGSHTSNGCV